MIEGFRNPLVLLLLVAPLILMALTWRRSGNEIAVPIDYGAQDDGIIKRWMIGVFEMLPQLLLAVVIVLLAGPTQWSEPKTRRTLTNIEFCVDNSSSMTSDFGGKTRYEAAMHAINDFVSYRKGDAFGLTFFSDAVLQWVPLTSDASAFKYALPFMTPELGILGGGTEIGRGLLACRKTLVERDVGDRLIILISDGASADLYEGRDVEIAKALKDDEIVVVDVHIADGEVPEEVVNICYLTGGEVFHPGDPETLASVFKRIDTFQKVRLEKISSEPEDCFAPVATMGMTILGLMGIGLFGMRYTPW